MKLFTYEHDGDQHERWQAGADDGRRHTCNCHAVEYNGLVRKTTTSGGKAVTVINKELTAVVVIPGIDSIALGGHVLRLWPKNTVNTITEGIAVSINSQHYIVYRVWRAVE